ncbi:MAG TPA: acyl-CoA dehydrogenase family protein [Pyrinomonadaceae bacterium]|nr:acyl-CoA dehydrogenase family protein [Pyrinomonadaceae bacterium]
MVDRVRELAQEKFAPRAADYDLAAAFPAEDFADLFGAGLIAPVVPAEYGGLGLGPYRGDVFTLWMMTKEIAKADLSLARCWEGHVNSLVLLDGMANDEQKARWFKLVVERGDKWVAWSGEPQSRAPGETRRFGTYVEKVEGGYVVEGNKVFSTSAGGAEWAILLVNTAGPGGVRHATAESLETQLLMACDLSDPTVEIDGSWWDPIGMRATVSYLVNFRRTFIPEENLIGYPGQYIKEGWQTCFIPHYAATFLGAAEAAYDYALEYVTTQHKTADPYVQHHVGQMSVDVETAHLWLRHVARLWETGKYAEAQVAGSRARHVVEHLAEETVKHCIRACGARCLNRPSALERIYRDLSFYVRHDNDDHILAMIGKSVLGLTHDPSFYKP